MNIGETKGVIRARRVRKGHQIAYIDSGRIEKCRREEQGTDAFPGHIKGYVRDECEVKRMGK